MMSREPPSIYRNLKKNAQTLLNINKNISPNSVQISESNSNEPSRVTNNIVDAIAIDNEEVDQFSWEFGGDPYFLPDEDNNREEKERNDDGVKDDEYDDEEDEVQVRGEAFDEDPSSAEEEEEYLEENNDRASKRSRNHINYVTNLLENQHYYDDFNIMEMIEKEMDEIENAVVPLLEIFIGL